MANEKRLIDANELKARFNPKIRDYHNCVESHRVIDSCPTVDAVEVDTILAWLYEMAMNNTDNYLCNACEEIISRLDGLRLFAKMDGGNDDA